MSELTITSICQLLETRGDYQLPLASVTVLQHALQTAWLAEQAGAANSLVAACLLHDIGHLLDAPAGQDAEKHLSHGPRAAATLDALFGKDVTEPIRLHVDAKRYLCYSHSAYPHNLTVYATRSLERQGGTFTPEEARAFMREPYAVDAVNLRLWDDQAQSSTMTTPGLAHFAATLRTCVLPKGSPHTDAPADTAC
jgi:predicted HD phosphohydrolase